MGARVAAENFVRVGCNLRQNAFVARAQQGDGVGEVELAMRVFRAQRSEARPELFEREAIDRWNSLHEWRAARASGALSSTIASTRPSASRTMRPYVAGIVNFGAENCGRGFSAAVGIEERGQSFGAQQRRVAGKDDRQLGDFANGTPGDLQGVAGAALGLLQDCLRAQAFGNRPHCIRLMANDHQRLRGFQRLTRTDHDFEQRPPTRAVQNLGEIRAHTCSFPRAQNHDGSIAGRHP